MRYAVIMAGGSGTRLWPMSTREVPKQLIPLFDGKSLLQVAVERLEGIVPPERIYICTGEAFREPIRKAMPHISDEQILGEPTGRDTLAAVGFPAAVLAKRDPDATLAIFTADHLIEPRDQFAAAVNTGFDLAEIPDTLVTFGIEPTHAATGYGYVKIGQPIDGAAGAFTTEQFKEKPDQVTAEAYVASGDYRWNSGMFVWRADTLLNCIERYQPQIREGLEQIASHWDSPGRASVLNEVYPTLKKISVDYAIMEPASADAAVNLKTVSMPVRWLDIGSWPAFADTLQQDNQSNSCYGQACLPFQSNGSVLINAQPNHLIATLGTEDLVIVHTESATLICHKDKAEQIKDLHALIGKKFGDAYL